MQPTPLRALRAILAGFIVIAGTARCKTSTEPGNRLSTFVRGVQTVNGTQGVLNDGSAPSGGAGQPIQIQTHGLDIIGGTSLVDVTSPTAVTHIVVAVEGVSGYFDVTLPSPSTRVSVLVTFSQDAPSSPFSLKFAAGQGPSNIGNYSDVPISLTQVGTGDIQATVSWDALSDVDLHVLDPSGQEVYYANDVVPSGGTLDLDSNADCVLDRKNAENITWPSSKALRGTYTVRVDYYNSCNVTQTNYVVTINVRGQTPRVITGSFTGRGDRGGKGSGVLISTFTY